MIAAATRALITVLPYLEFAGEVVIVAAWIRPSTMEDNKMHLQAINSTWRSLTRPGFDEKDIEHLPVLIRVTVEFHDYLTSAPLGHNSPTIRSTT